MLLKALIATCVALLFLIIIINYICFPGDIAFRYLDGVLSTLSKKDIDESRISNDIVICDINKSMLEVGRRRAHNLGIDKGKP